MNNKVIEIYSDLSKNLNSSSISDNRLIKNPSFEKKFQYFKIGSISNQMIEMIKLYLISIFQYHLGFSTNSISNVTNIKPKAIAEISKLTVGNKKIKEILMNSIRKFRKDKIDFGIIT